MSTILEILGSLGVFLFGINGENFNFLKEYIFERIVRDVQGKTGRALGPPIEISLHQGNGSPDGATSVEEKVIARYSGNKYSEIADLFTPSTLNSTTSSNTARR